MTRDILRLSAFILVHGVILITRSPKVDRLAAATPLKCDFPFLASLVTPAELHQHQQLSGRSLVYKVKIKNPGNRDGSVRHGPGQVAEEHGGRWTAA